MKRRANHTLDAVATTLAAVVVAALLLFSLSCLLHIKSPGEFEAFTERSEREFLRLQHTINPHVVFDMNVLATQVPQGELDAFLRAGSWDWSPETERLFVQQSKHNPYVRSVPTLSAQHAKTVYNDQAMRRVLSLQTKEVDMLANGVLVPASHSSSSLPSLPRYAESSGLAPASATKDVIRCSASSSSGEPHLERVRTAPTRDRWNSTREITQPVDPDDMERLVPGFRYVDHERHGRCNPCDALSANPRYDCPFVIRTKPYATAVHGSAQPLPTISPIWKSLWGLS